MVHEHSQYQVPFFCINISFISERVLQLYYTTSTHSQGPKKGWSCTAIRVPSTHQKHSWNSVNPLAWPRAWAKQDTHTTMHRWKGTSTLWRTNAPICMNSGRRRRCTRQWRNLPMSSTTMYGPIPIMDTNPLLKHGAPNDRYMACSKIPSRRKESR